MKKIRNLKLFYSLIIAFIIITNISTVCADDVDDELLEENIIEEVVETTATPTIEVPKTNSRKFEVYDRKSKTVLFGKDEDIKTAMASTTKIMTATIILENANLNEEVTVSGKAGGTGGSRLGLKKRR